MIHPSFNVIRLHLIQGTAGDFTLNDGEYLTGITQEITQNKYYKNVEI